MLRTNTKFERGVAAFCRRLRAAARVRIFASTAGFTLLEAVLSSALVAIAGMGVLMMFSTAHTFVQSSGTDRISAQLAQQRIEQVRATGYGTKFPPDPREETTWTPVPNNPGFERTTVITEVCSTNFAIAWTDGACPDSTGLAPQARIVVVTVRALNASQPVSDPQTTPVVMQTVLVRR